MKISAAIEKFLAHQFVCGSTDSTILHYRNQLKFFKDFMNDCDITLITIDDYDNYIIYLRTKNKLTRVAHNCNEKLASRTVKTYASALKTFLSFLYRKHYINTDISSDITMPRYKKKAIIILTNEQIQQLIDSQNDFTFTGARNLFIISLMLDCGLRLIEVSRLHFCDIFLDRRLLKADGKGQKERLVPMSDITIHYYKMYLSMLEERINRSLFSEEILLKNQNGTNITKNSIALIFKRLKKKLRFKDLHPHLLRHTFATMFILNRWRYS